MGECNTRERVRESSLATNLVFSRVCEEFAKICEISTGIWRSVKLKVVPYPHIVIVSVPQTMSSKPMTAFLLSFS